MNRTKKEEQRTQAVIYVRQACASANWKESDAVEPQEAACFEYAKAKGYQVERVFRDVAVSGVTTDSPGMNDLLGFLRTRDFRQECVVILTDAARIGRTVQAYFHLHGSIVATGATVETVNTAHVGKSGGMKLTLGRLA